jgi:putative flippase GtrA
VSPSPGASPAAGAGELVRFAVIGLAAYLTDVAVFNLLLLGAGTPSGWAKALSGAVAIAVAFLGSRHYTWRDRRTDAPGREYVLFLFFSLLAAGIQLGCLLISHDLLGLQSALADNVSANVIGMGLATVFRFVTFRTYVFPRRPEVLET